MTRPKRLTPAILKAAGYSDARFEFACAQLRDVPFSHWLAPAGAKVESTWYYAETGCWARIASLIGIGDFSLVPVLRVEDPDKALIVPPFKDGVAFEPNTGFEIFVRANDGAHCDSYGRAGSWMPTEKIFGGATDCTPDRLATQVADVWGAHRLRGPKELVHTVCATSSSKPPDDDEGARLMKFFRGRVADTLVLPHKHDKAGPWQAIVHTPGRYPCLNRGDTIYTPLKIARGDVMVVADLEPGLVKLTHPHLTLSVWLPNAAVGLFYEEANAFGGRDRIWRSGYRERIT